MNGLMPRRIDGLGLFDRYAVPAHGDSNFKRMAERWQPFETGSGMLWIAAPAATRVMQRNAGRAYARMQLQATAAGLAMHPLSQALQEFSEVQAPYVGMRQLLGLNAAKTPLQMLVRVGYADSAVGPAPRRPLGALLQG